MAHEKRCEPKRDVELDSLRHEIDQLDTRLVNLLAQRLRCAERIQAHKRRAGLLPRSPDRESDVLRKVSTLAHGVALDAKLIQGIYSLLFHASQKTIRAPDPLTGQANETR